MNFYPIVVLAQRALPRHVGFASGVTLGLSIGLGSLASPLLGVLADNTSLRTALFGRRLPDGARGARLARAPARGGMSTAVRRRARRAGAARTARSSSRAASRPARRSSHRSPATSTRACSRRSSAPASRASTAIRPTSGRPRGAASTCACRTGHGERQVARVHAARAGGRVRAQDGACALHLPDQGAGAGSGARPAQLRARPAAGGLRRRHAARAAPPRAPLREPDPHEPRHAARRRPAEPPALGRRALESHARRRSTRRTPTAASSARTWRSCCGGCGASARSTAASRSSCSRARRSPTPPRPAPR